MKVTLDDIAKKTGLSKSTVSRAFSQPELVNPDTKKKVEAAARKLGYEPRSSHSEENAFIKTIMMLSRDIKQPAHVEYYRAISAEMLKKGYVSFLVDCNKDKELERQYLNYAADNHFAGIFIFSYFGHDLNIDIKQNKIPVVMVNNYPLTSEYDVVCMDNYRCGYTAAKILTEYGHKKMKFIGWPKGSVTSRDRFRGFIDALNETIQIPDLKEWIFETELTYDKGYDIGVEISKGKPEYSALFVSDMDVAEGILDALSQHGVSVPEDMSIIASGAFSSKKYKRQEITSLYYDNAALGKTAAEIMIHHVDNKQEENYIRKVVLMPVLKEGTTVSFPREEQSITHD